jgi:hypothetical protein
MLELAAAYTHASQSSISSLKYFKILATNSGWIILTSSLFNINKANQRSCISLEKKAKKNYFSKSWSKSLGVRLSVRLSVRNMRSGRQEHWTGLILLPFDAEFFLRNTIAIADPQDREVPIQIRKKRFFSAVFGSRDIFLEFFFTFSIQFTMLILDFFTPTL